MTTGFQTNSLTQQGKNINVGCFIVERGSSLEMRDCYIHSKKDSKVAEAEKELLIEAKLRGEEEPELADVEDYCIIMNGHTIESEKCNMI